MSVIRMYATSRLIDLAKPHPDQVEIRDIAKGLSQVNRFTGHTVRPYSVAEHSVMLSYNVPMHHALDALMHDAAEAYLGDVSSPLKALLPEYRLLEVRWMQAIFEKFDMTPRGWQVADVKRMDDLALGVELDLLVKRGQPPPDRPPSGYTRMRSMILVNTKITPDGAEKLFLDRFHQIVAEWHIAQSDARRGRAQAGA